MKPVAMSSAWNEVFAGPIWKAEMLRGELEQEGIVSFIPDSNMKRLDPFDVGGNIFDFKLLVPAEQAARAVEIVGNPQPEQYDERPAESLSEPRVDATTARLEAQGRRIRWSSFVVAFAPYGLWLALSYIPAAARTSPRPASHRLTLIASVLCLFETILWVGALVFTLLSKELEAFFTVALPW